MKINGIEGLTPDQLRDELQRGAKFVVYQYCISVLVMTFRRGTDIYYIRPGESAQLKGIQYTLLTLVAGWWGIPWGPIYSIGSLITNLGGGKDVTPQVASSLFPPQPQYSYGAPQQGTWPPPPGAPAQGVDSAPNYYSQPPR